MQIFFIVEYQEETDQCVERSVFRKLFFLLLLKHLVFTAAYCQLLLSLNGFPEGENKHSASVLSLVDKPINTGSQQFRTESHLIVGLEFLIQSS